MSKLSKKTGSIKVVTLSELDRGSKFCACPTPQKALKPVNKIRFKALGRLGFGRHCVIDKQGEPIRCFRNKRVAKKVARGFGPGFRVKSA